MHPLQKMVSHQMRLKLQTRKMNQKQARILIKNPRKNLRRSLKRNLKRSSSAGAISDANMTMTRISCTEEALMMRRWPLKKLTVLSVRLQ